MPKYIFDIDCSEDILGSDSRHTKIKLVGSVNGKEKTIKFCGPCTGAYGILKKWTRPFSTMG